MSAELGMDPTWAHCDPIIADCYEGDYDGKPNVEALVEAGWPWCGLILKATEGTYYPRDPNWFRDKWVRTLRAAGARLGHDFVRGAYHYLRLDEDSEAQANHFCEVLADAGGWRAGDLLMVDVERAENPTPDPGGLDNPWGREVERRVTAFAERTLARTGIRPVLYGGEYLRAYAVAGNYCSCGALVTARYAPTLPPAMYQDVGADLGDPHSGAFQLMGWQYNGTDGVGGLRDYPSECPLGKGHADLTVLVCHPPHRPQEWLERLS